MVLEKLGIYGWQNIEIPLLCALITDKPILFVGDHGTNKTDGAKIIAKTFLGPKTRFQKYDTHLINTDDLVGIIDAWNKDPSKPLDYRPTIYSLWDKDAVLFDEFALAIPRVQARVIELIRTREVMGKKTNLKLVMCSSNPPGVYDTTFIGLQTASRMVTMTVPPLSKLTKEELGKILRAPGGDIFDLKDPRYPQMSKIGKALKKAQRRYRGSSKEVAEVMEETLFGLGTSLSNASVRFSTRQLKDVRDLWFGYKALLDGGYKARGKEGEHLRSLVYAMIPEISNMVRTGASINVDEVRNAVVATISVSESGHSWLFSRGLEDIIKMRNSEVTDAKAWAVYLVRGITTTEDMTLLPRVFKRIAKSPLVNFKEEMQGVIGAVVARVKNKLKETVLDPSADPLPVPVTDPVAGFQGSLKFDIQAFEETITSTVV